MLCIQNGRAVLAMINKHAMSGSGTSYIVMSHSEYLRNFGVPHRIKDPEVPRAMVQPQGVGGMLCVQEPPVTRGT
eukprot:12902235-Prorocentrum_lima.AAC.1